MKVLTITDFKNILKRNVKNIPNTETLISNLKTLEKRNSDYSNLRKTNEALHFRGIKSKSNTKRNAWLLGIHGKHHEALYLLTLSLCRRFGHDESFANDMMQEFYIEILHNYEKIVQRYNDAGIKYLIQIIKFNVLDWGRRKKTRIRLGEVLIQQLPNTNKISCLCFDDYTDTFLESLSKCLAETDFDIMKLYLSGYSYQEIGNMVGMKESSVGVRINRAKQKLRVALDLPEKKERIIVVSSKTRTT